MNLCHRIFGLVLVMVLTFPTVHFSLLTGGLMLAALACVLLVLPACIVLADRPGKGARN